ncbi:hypothetical protein ACRS6Y_02875 [Bacillus cytotoxicus]|nr:MULTISPECIES: hypothetical protein [Bacillus cereus group]QTR72091.1 hypothetical protein JC775_05830 [Bacillus cytotoxicus]QTR77226.1 hypothetical protein JC773_11560 [Bacillus cytotoxicus]HDR4570711.1 hypothetical protein [Bacillus cytotoxicus]HDR4586523.1 hypothetical protein [Bacillus cytotoxicus]
MSRVKFYSEYDMACGWQLEKIVEKVNNEVIDSEWGITDLLDFHNVLKYISVERFSDYIVEETSVDIKAYEKKIKQKIGIFMGCYKDVFLNLYDEIEFGNKGDFFEILEGYKIYQKIEINDFRHFLEKSNVHIYIVLKFKRLTEYFNEAVKDVLLADSRNAETILSKYLKKDDLYLPPSLNETDILNLIDEYIDSPQVNINVLRQIINFPTNKGLNIPDKIKLHAKRKAKEEEEKVFTKGTGIESGVRISYPQEQDEAILVTMDGRTADIKVSRKWIEENIDFPTLWNNFIYLFGFFDGTMRLAIDSKKSDSSALESVFRPQGEHLYNQSTSFYFKEMLSNAEIYSYVNVLNVLSIRLEEMIEWFFEIYLKEEFQINDFIVKMPSSEASYFEKCRTILPEIDRIFKQYNTLIEDGMIDQELIQMSSSSFKNKDIKSFNRKKYVYSSSDWYKTASFLLFSDQSSIVYLPNKEEEYKNFFDLITLENLTRSDFEEYQLKDIQWLFDNNLICESNMGYLEFADQRAIYILKELYYKEVMSYWHYPQDIQVLIEELSTRNLVDFENSLFSRNEQDYLDYYLNKSKFTNGHDIRNKYLHGTNTNDEKQYESDYYLILKLFVIIVIKINDDLCIKEDKEKS